MSFSSGIKGWQCNLYKLPYNQVLLLCQANNFTPTTNIYLVLLVLLEHGCFSNLWWCYKNMYLWSVYELVGTSFTSSYVSMGIVTPIQLYIVPISVNSRVEQTNCKNKGKFWEKIVCQMVIKYDDTKRIIHRTPCCWIPTCGPGY